MYLFNIFYFFSVKNVITEQKARTRKNAWPNETQYQWEKVILNQEQVKLWLKTSSEA